MQSSYASPQSSSSVILQSIRKHPFTQIVEGQEITYSVLCKKQQTFLFGNDRFLLLKGIQSISYAREFPQHQKLPFRHPAQLPPPKVTFPLSEIQHFNNDQELLTIQFSGDKRVRWDFVCPSKVCALEWRQKLDQAVQALGEFTLSGFANYQDFIRNKEMIANQRYNQQVNEANSLLGFNDNISMQSEAQSRTRNLSATSNRMQPYNIMQPNPTSTIQNNTFQQQSTPFVRQGTEHSNLIPVTNIDKTSATVTNQEKVVSIGIEQAFSQSKQPQRQQQDKKGQLSYSPSSIFNSNQKVKTHNESSHHFSPIDSYNEIDRPTILFKGQKIGKMQDFNNNNDFMNRSISQLSYSQKERLKTQISKLRRNWVQQQLAGEQIVSLVIDFRNYVQRIAEVIINQLHIPKQLKMYPCHQQSRQHTVYLHEDLHLQIYYYSEQHLIEKNPKYKDSVVQFKNLDYLLGVTKNQSIIKVPLMMLFEYKGFLGMAKVKIDSNGQPSNKELYNLIDRKQFQIQTKISAESLLNEKYCKIVRYEGKTSLSKMINNGSKAYFVEKLTKFLPTQIYNNKISLLRPQFVQDEELDDIVFRDESKQIKQQWISEVVQRKINNLVSILQNQKQYFTNSKELSDIVHYFGLNMRHIGLIYKKVKQHWLKRLIKDDIIARCLKNYFRFDVQNIVKQNLEKDNEKERQEQREKNRVISFFNIIFGNTETTFRIWRNINSFAQQAYHVKIWQNQFSDINVAYLLQSVQKHLKIVLNNSIYQRTPFKNMNTFQSKDFIKFQFDSTIYNLQFSDIFEEIHECLDDQTFDSFHILCEVLTKQTPSKLTYFQILKDHPINQKIQEFLLEFTSPHDNHQLYNKIQASPLPSSLVYESKLAEIKWYLKSGKHEEANKPINFMQTHLRKWLGDVHPLFTSLNRLLAEYFLQQQLFYGVAIKYAQASLDMQQSLFGGDCEQLWKDYFLIGKIHFLNNHPQDSLTFLTKSKNLVNVQTLTDFQVYGDLCLMLAKCYFGGRYFQQSYSISKQLYKLIRGQRDERSLTYLLEAVSMIKQLLDINQEHESFERFVENDFSQIASAFADHPNLMSACIKIIAIPNLKNVLLKNSKNRTKLLTIIDHIAKITQSAHSCITFLKSKMIEGAFPKNYQQCLKDIDSVIEQIQQNQMLQRWTSFNKMANDAILDKISGSINRVFEFMAFLTAIFNLLGSEVLSELFIMQK